MAGQVLEQYKQLFGPAFLPRGKPLDPNAQEERKTQLLGELNYSGKFFAFKEQMKVRDMGMFLLFFALFLSHL